MTRRAASLDDKALALAVTARLVELYGEAYLPFFVRMEGVLRQAHEAEAALQRALAMRSRIREVGLTPGALLQATPT